MGSKFVKVQTSLAMRLPVSLMLFYFTLVTQSAHATIDNTVTVRGTAPGGPPNQIFDTADETVDVADADNSLTVVKTANLNDLDGDNLAAVGETITYTFDVTNNGNVTIQNVRVNDVTNATGGPVTPSNEVIHDDVLPLNDSSDTASGINNVWDALAPGDTVRFSATYTVTQDDLDTLN